MKIAILNAKYSRNLGDGAIAECLEYQLGKRIKGSAVISIDVAGSTAYGGYNSLITPKTMGGFRLLPEWMLRALRYALRPILVKIKFATHWKAKLHDCNAIVIGGGQLIMDVQRYFPVRISIAVKSAPKNIPLFVCSVGVSKELTPAGKDLFASAFKHGRFISATVRDSRSRENWENHFPGLPVEVAFDPALLARDSYAVHFEKNAASSNAGKVIALGISDPTNMRMHADNPDALVGGDSGFYIEIVRKLLLSGFSVSVFNNGDDVVYMEYVISELAEDLAENGEKITVQPNPEKPIDLIKQINAADVVISHRLHANILSYAYKIPSIGLMWDQKVENFFDLTDRREFLVKENKPDNVIEKVKRALKVGIDPSHHSRIIGAAEKGIDLLAESLKREIVIHSEDAIQPVSTL